MKHLIPALALSAILTGCIQTAPVKPEVVTPKPAQDTATDVANSCMRHGRYVMRYRDENGNWVYVTFECRPISNSSQKPAIPGSDQGAYLRPEAIGVGHTINL